MNRYRRGFKGMLAVGALVAGAGVVRAEGPTISGYVDTQYHYNFQKPFDRTTNLRSYDNLDNNISLNAAHIAIVGSAGDAGYVIELDAGEDQKVTSGNGTSQADVQEAYLTYKHPQTLLGVKVGKFVTFHGIEVIESKDNPTITRGFLFGLAEPFTHTGGLLTYNAGGKVDVAAGVVNGWDLPRDNNKDKTLAGRIGMNLGDPLALGLSAYHGSEQPSGSTGVPSAEGRKRTSVDLTGVTKILPKTALWFQALWGQEDHAVLVNPGPAFEVTPGYSSWNGVTLQPVVDLTDRFFVGARLEYFYDKDGVRTNQTNPDPAAGGARYENVALTNLTIAPGFKLTPNATVQAEYRYDKANKKIWEDDDQNGGLKDTNSTVALQFVYAF